ncbi:MAG: hypothetical protein HOV80_28370 [Polyangiaceae bacterium]|nr:hypothetical protein [Polyangiaceae bacterium]
MSLLGSLDNAARLSILVTGLALAAWGCGDECDADDCEPCVGETCTAACVSPDDEDDAEYCPYSCSDGADCSLTCRAVSCHLTCDASTCECGGCESISCTNGSDCHAEYSGNIACDASTCESTNSYSAVCTNGATCTLACDSSNDVGCGTSCDATSACHVECHGRCVLCCNGSADCAMDCAFEPTTCSDGRIACGVACEDAVAVGTGPFCPPLPNGG